MRLFRINEPRYLMHLARLKNSRDFEGLEHLLRESDKQICQNLKVKTGEDFLREQGAAQVVDELLEYFDKIEGFVEKARS